MEGRTKAKGKVKAGGKQGVPPLEWASAALGGLIALVLIALVGWNAITASEEPVPKLSAEIIRIVPAEGAHLLDIRLANASARSAASVQIEVSLKKGGEEVETSSATIDYVPGRSEAFGGLLVKEDPRAHEVELRVTGYEIP